MFTIMSGVQCRKKFVTRSKVKVTYCVKIDIKQLVRSITLTLVAGVLNLTHMFTIIRQCAVYKKHVARLMVKVTLQGQIPRVCVKQLLETITLFSFIDFNSAQK